MEATDHELTRCDHGKLIPPFAERVASGEVIPELFESASWNVGYAETLAATGRKLLPEFVAMLDELATKRNCLRCFGHYVETHHIVLRAMLKKFRGRVDEAISKTRNELERLENIIKCITNAWDSLAVTIEQRDLLAPGTQGYVYAIEDGDYVKIGWAISPLTRLAQLQTASARQLRLLGAIRSVFATERELHDRFRQHHYRGEWFMLNDEIRTYFLSTSAQRTQTNRQPPSRPSKDRKNASPM